MGLRWYVTYSYDLIRCKWYAKKKKKRIVVKNLTKTLARVFSHSSKRGRSAGKPAAADYLRGVPDGRRGRRRDDLRRGPRAGSRPRGDHRKVLPHGERRQGHLQDGAPRQRGKQLAEGKGESASTILVQWIFDVGQQVNIPNQFASMNLAMRCTNLRLQNILKKKKTFEQPEFRLQH